MRHSGGVTSSIEVRPATQDDFAAVGRISVEAYDAAGQLEPRSLYREVLADAETRFHRGLLLVAERDGEVVGTITICPHDSFLAEICRQDELEFRFLAVDPSAWQSGVANALIQACEEQARRSGAAQLAICVQDTNTGAAAMYAKCGFMRDPGRDWSPLQGINLLALTRPVATTP
jgi:GNAT superfamily N-acetyltransferase